MEDFDINDEELIVTNFTELNEYIRERVIKKKYNEFKEYIKKNEKFI
jgi:hypothetical protein